MGRISSHPTLLYLKPAAACTCRSLHLPRLARGEIFLKGRGQWQVRGCRVRTSSYVRAHRLEPPSRLRVEPSTAALVVAPTQYRCYAPRLPTADLRDLVFRRTRE